MQGHHLKYDDAGNLVFFFLGYTNEILLPNPELSLYKSSEITFTHVEQEEAHRSSISSRATRSSTRNEAGSSHQPPPTPTPLVPQAYHVEWFPTMQTPRFTHGYQPGSRHTPQAHEASVSGWQEANDPAWRYAHSSDSEGLPPLVHPRQLTSDHRGRHQHSPQRIGDPHMWDSKYA